MDPLSNKPARIAPFFRGIKQELSLFEEPVVQIVLPVSKLIKLESAVGNILIAICFDPGGIAGYVTGRRKVFPF